MNSLQRIAHRHSHSQAQPRNHSFSRSHFSHSYSRSCCHTYSHTQPHIHGHTHGHTRPHTQNSFHCGRQPNPTQPSHCITKNDAMTTASTRNAVHRTIIQGTLPILGVCWAGVEVPTTSILPRRRRHPTLHRCNPWTRLRQRCLAMSVPQQ